MKMSKKTREYMENNWIVRSDNVLGGLSLNSYFKGHDLVILSRWKIFQANLFNEETLPIIRRYYPNLDSSYYVQSYLIRALVLIAFLDELE